MLSGWAIKFMTYIIITICSMQWERRVESEPIDWYLRILFVYGFGEIM